MNPAAREAMAERRALIPAVTGSPYAADLLADVVLDVVPGDGLVRRCMDAAAKCPQAVALMASARTREEREAVIGSITALARRTALSLSPAF